MAHPGGHRGHRGQWGDSSSANRSPQTLTATSGPDHKIWIDRTNLQSAQSAVLVKHNGVEYAIVGDDPNPFDDPQNPNLNQAWNVAKLIDAALQQPEADALRKHITLEAGTEQLVNVPANQNGYVTAPAGTVFDPPEIVVNVDGNMGDVFEVNVRKLVEKTLAEQGVKTTLDTLRLDVKDLTPYTTEPTRNGFKLLTKDKDLVGGTGEATFEQTGVFYAVPNLTGTRKTPTADVDEKLQATDARHGVFFGDRPQDNPGYSAMTLSAQANGKALTSLGLVGRVLAPRATVQGGGGVITYAIYC